MSDILDEKIVISKGVVCSEDHINKVFEVIPFMRKPSIIFAIVKKDEGVVF
ncbi:hypothetical protein [Falsibacillus albus]|uniref:hypothetical protein n=1 Tax=Falsibacillus albus TaxID=2478915 RepID=UPI001313DCC4|nr:hypothetical protein [Falsibacillus albus]